MSILPEGVPTNSEHVAAAVTKRQETVVAAILILLPLLVFAQVRNFEFVNYDDGSYVTKCPQVQRGLTPETINWAFSRSANSVTANWHPLTWLSLMLDVTLFGVNARAMHIVNLAMHLANVLLVYSVVKSMTMASLRSAFVAAVFAIHPLHVESVAWISERKDVLSTLFVLLSIKMYLSYTSDKRMRWIGASLCFFVLSLMTKQMYVTLPFLLLLLDFWPLQRAWTDKNKSTISLSRSLIEKLPYLATTLLFCGIAVVGQQDGHAVGSLDEYPMTTRLFNAAIAYLLYVQKSLFPFQLAVFYPYPNGSLLISGTLSACIIAAITIAVFRTRVRYPYVFVGWCWYLGTLVPVIGIIQIGAQRMADRYTYFPLIGLAILAVWTAADAFKRIHVSPRRSTAIGCVVVSFLAWRAHNQTGHWKDSITLFSHAATVAESALAYTKLGFEQAQRSDFDRAAHSFYSALEINPEYVSAHRSLGNLCLAEGRPAAAIGHLQRTLRLDPQDAEAHYNLGISLSGLGKTAEAIEYFEHALNITSGKAEVAANLGTAYLLQNDAARAVTYLEEAIRKDPELPQANYYLGLAYRELGRNTEALNLLLKLRDTNESPPDLNEQLARIYEDLGDLQEAEFYRTNATPNTQSSPPR